MHLQIEEDVPPTKKDIHEGEYTEDDVVKEDIEDDEDQDDTDDDFDDDQDDTDDDNDEDFV